MDTLAPRSEYEFGGSQPETIRLLSSRMYWVGVFQAAVAAVSGLAALAEIGHGVTGAVAHLVGSAFLLLIAVWTIRAANAFSRVVTTEGNDIANLMDALS